MARFVGGAVQNVPMRRFIISPDDLCYRIWCYFLALLSVYTCLVSAVQWGFITPQTTSVFIVDNIINGMFAVDILVTFRVAYIDGNTYVTVDNPKKIAKNYLKMIVVHLIMCFPFEFVGNIFDISSRTHKILNLLRFLRLFRFHRLWSFYSRLEKSDKINFTYIRTAMIITVACLVTHSWACIFYSLASFPSDPRETWIGSQNPKFLQEKWWKTYLLSIYWAVVTLSTVGYGDWHPVGLLEMSFTVVFLCVNVIVMAYIIGYITNWMAPAMGKIEEYNTRRSLAQRFCDRNGIPTPIRDEILSHLSLEYTTALHGFQYYKDQQLIQSMPKAIKARILHFLCGKMSDSYLFEDVSTETQFQVVQTMKVVSFPANASVILQNEVPTCFYFIYTGSVDLIIFENGIEQVAGTIKVGNFVGESCVFVNKAQMFTIKTKELSQLVKIDRATFFDILERNPSDGSVMINNHIKLLNTLNDPYLNRVLRELEYKLTIGRIDVPISICFAAHRDYGQLFYRMLLRGDPNESNNEGKTPLHIVASRRDLPKVTSLCEHGADPNIKDLDGNTALHVAVREDNIDIVRCLLKNGAKHNIANKDGITPFQLANGAIQNLLMSDE